MGGGDDLSCGLRVARDPQPFVTRNSLLESVSWEALIKIPYSGYW
jgi:hypothetical protein